MPVSHAPRPALTLEQTARRLGHCRWLEMRLFEVVGGWVASEGDAEVKLHFAIQSRRHGWRAGLLATHLPETPHVAPDLVTVAPGPSTAAALAALAAADGTTARLAGVVRVLLPALVAAYDQHLEVVSPVTDGSTARALRIVVADAVAELQEGEALLAARLGGGGLDAAAEAQRAALAAEVAADGGLLTAPDPVLS